MNVLYHEQFDMDLQNPIRIECHRGNNKLFCYLNHWHRALEINYLLGCNIDYWINGEKHPAKIGDIVVINSGDIHSTYPVDVGVRLASNIYVVSLFVSYEYLKILYPDIDNITFRLSSHPEQLSMLRSAFDSLYETYTKEHEKFTYVKLHSIVDQMLYLLFTYFAEEKPESTLKSQQFSKRIQPIMDWMEQNYTEPMTLLEIAQRFGMSSEYLSKIFKTYTGTSFKHYLNKIRLNHAYMDVIGTDYSMLEISMRNGFADVRSFNSVFKEQYGMAPFQYRKYASQYEFVMETSASMPDKPFARFYMEVPTDPVSQN